MSEDIKEQFWVLPMPKWHKSDKPLSIDQLGSKQALHHVDFTGKRVLVRVDYNVPIKGGKITDTSRVDSTIPTLEYILKPSCRGKDEVKRDGDGFPQCVVLICHLGRPGGKFKKEDFSLKIVADYLAAKIKDLAPVVFLPDCVGPDVEKAINTGPKGTVYVCENLRYHIEETGDAITAQGKTINASDEDVTRFRKALTALGDVFVFEAFGAAHRPHASVVGIDLPQRVAGKEVELECRYYAKVLGNPQRPFLAIIGGAKVSDKIKVLDNLLNIVDELIIGGGMAYTFKKVAFGVKIGSSIFDKEGSKVVESVIKKAKERGVKLHFPIDHVVADKFAPDAKVDYATDETGIPDGMMALDIGEKSRQLVSEVIGRAQTILWNGPLGVFEFPAFAAGTEKAMQDMVVATERGATTILGGGDTGAASVKFKYKGKPVADQLSHVSTGGGSSLVLMEGTMLPGLDALSDVSELPPQHIDVKQLYLYSQRLKRDVDDLKQEVANLRKLINAQGGAGAAANGDH